MFFTYLWRELRRRMRQAIFIAIGLALGIGLVITVTAASTGVKNAQASVLHSLYGVDTDITVTKAPTTSSGSGFGFSFNQGIGTRTAPKAGTTINNNTLSSDVTLASLPSSDVTGVAKMQNVAAAAGGLTLSDQTISGKVPAINFSGGAGGGGFAGGSSGGSGSGNPSSFRSSFKFNSFTVNGVDIANGELGPLSTGKISSGRTFTTADDSSDVALVDASWAASQKPKLAVGDTIDIGNSKNAATKFTIVGLVSEPAGDDPANIYIPLGVAQSLSGLKNDINTIYVAAASSQDISSLASSISKAVPGSTVTDESSVASEVTGSISNTASLANNLGKWLAIAVLVAAFLLASLLTMSAVSRRIREFGTLKALGWKSRRIVGQVMGESVVVGIIGGAVGVGLGILGASLIDKFTKPMTATLGSTTGSATPGGSRLFSGSGGFPAGGAPGGAGVPGGGGGSGTPFRGAFTGAQSAANTVSVPLHASITVDVVIVAVILAILGGLIAGSFGGWRAARLRPAAALSKVA